MAAPQADTHEQDSEGHRFAPYYMGDLRSGIALALQRNVAVAVIVTEDESEETSRWETEWLLEDDIAGALHKYAVLLCVSSNTVDAHYLAAFCTLRQMPNLLIIHNGQLIEHIDGGLTHEDFRRRLLKALLPAEASSGSQPTNVPDSEPPADSGLSHDTGTTNSNPSTSLPSTQVQQPSQNRSEQSSEAPSKQISEQPTEESLEQPLGEPVAPASDQPPEQPSEQPAEESLEQPSDQPSDQPSNQDPTTTSSSTPTQSSTVQRMLDERRQRLDAERKAQEEAARADREARKRAQKDARDAAPAAGPARPRKAGELSYAQEQVARKREARLERERILRVIANDRLERKEKEEQRRALARAEAEADAEAERGSVQEDAESDGVRQGTPAPAAGSACFVQVRMPDGSSIRASFAAEHTLAGEVRAWIDGKRAGGSYPYVLKQILLPQPSRTMSDEEESETLKELGLLPSATLIVVPVQGYVSAYSDGSSGFFGSAWAMVFAFFASIVEYIKYFLGMGAGVPANTNGSTRTENDSSREQTQSATGVDGTSEHEPNSNGTTSGSKIRIRTLASHNAEKKSSQFYNGNQLNFEPNDKDDAEEQDKDR